jgi:hypothetical protein
MIVRENDGRAVVPQSFFDDFARMDTRPIYSSTKKIFASNHAMPIVEVDQRKGLVWPLSQSGDEEIRGEARGVQQGASAYSCAQRLAGAVHDFVQGGFPESGARVVVCDE